MTTVHYMTSVGPDLQRSEFNDWFMSHHDQLKRCLWLLDGVDEWGFVLWPGPDGVDFWDVDMTKYPLTFLQAGGTRDAMAIEWKTHRDGAFRQYAIGRPGARPSRRAEEPDQEIPLGDTRIFAYEHEVFSYEEAADIFHHYFLHGNPPATYELRDLGLPFGPDGKVHQQ